MHRQYRIHPAIGIARLGDSEKLGDDGRPHPDSYFVGPESPGDIPLGSGPYRLEGHIKRQAARFRIYEYLFDDTDWTLQGVREITDGLDDATITWHVQLANRKAASKTLLSLGSPDDQRPDRNPGIAQVDLIIDTGPQQLSGVNVCLTAGGQFQGTPVKLGDWLTDEAGRLLVLGGHGKSMSVPANLPMDTFCDNAGWCDDTSDGPVSATVRFGDGPEIPMDQSSWVIVAPPDYAPAIPNVVTLYDVAFDVATSIDPMLAVGAHTDVSFTKDIFPILARSVLLQWVLADARKGHSGDHPGNFMDSDRMAKLANNTDTSAANRTAVFDRLVDPRAPTATGPTGQRDMPRLNTGLNPQAPAIGSRVRASLTPYQYDLMKRWRDGLFTADWPGSPPAAAKFADLPAAEQPAALDRAALDACVGSPFFPGIEAGFIMARRETYGSTPLRIAQDTPAGGLTAGNAVPWQADFIECGVNWWPAQRPVSVYRASGTMPELWTGPGVPAGRPAQHQWMVNNWANLGFIVADGDRFDEEDLTPGQP